MAEYINRFTARNELYEADAITMKGVKILNQIPTEDVAPVKHGRWIVGRSMLYRTQYHCSECGRDIVVFKYSKTSLKDYPYCHCGASMDGAENEE